MVRPNGIEPTHGRLYQFIFAMLVVGVALFSAPQVGSAQQTVTVTGRVLTVSGAPARDATVRIIPGTRSARVNGEGVFELPDMPLGQYQLEIESTQYGGSLISIEVRAGTFTPITITLDPLYHMDALVVTASPGAIRRSEAYQATSILTAKDLSQRAEASLGETLSKAAGVNSTYFGPGSSRPIIRGLGGDRIRILESGVDVGDASNTSPDHAVSLEARSADRIEIVRGPATLLYGSSAVGGVVNVLDQRIPRQRPTERIGGFAEGLGSSVSNELTGQAELNVSLGRIVVHGGALRRSTDDYSIPGFAQLPHEGEEPGEDGGIEGTLENSAVSTTRGAVGASYVGDNGYVGLSFTGFNTEYGVPGGHGHGEEEGEEAEGEEEEEEVSIDLEQRRFDFEASSSFDDAFLTSIKGRLGVTNYTHTELEGTATGTVFDNSSWDARAEATHLLGDEGTGAFGMQLSNRDFSAIGEEAFIPPTETSRFAVFTYEEFAANSDFSFQVGGRFERAAHTATGVDLSHSGVSVSTGANFHPSENWSIGATVARSMKLPTAEELFSNGPHAATSSFETGDPNLGNETALSFDGVLHAHGEQISGTVSGFYTRFGDFIYQRLTGEINDGLDTYAYVQGDAAFSGFELEGEVEVLHEGPRHLSLSGTADYVRATLVDTDEPLPRIPPFRVGVGFDYGEGALSVGANVRYHAAQDRVADLEEETSSYTLGSGSVSYQLYSGGLVHQITFIASNLFNQEARVHASFLREFAPLPGRDLRVVYRLVF